MYTTSYFANANGVNIAIIDGGGIWSFVNNLANLTETNLYDGWNTSNQLSSRNYVSSRKEIFNSSFLHYLILMQLHNFVV